MAKIKTVLIFLCLTLTFFTSVLFADATIYVTNQNEENVNYSVHLSPSITVHGNANGTIEASADHVEAFTLETDEMDDHLKDELIKIDFLNGSGTIVCSAEFPIVVDDPSAFSPSVNDSLSNCTIQPSGEDFQITVSKRNLSAY